MNTFVHVLLPILLVFFCGYILRRKKEIDIKSISTISIYILTPSLVFRTFYGAILDKQYLYMAIFAFLLFSIFVIINKIYSKMRGHPKDIESGLILSTAFMNAGNYGSPVILFAYGELGFAFSISFLVIQSIIVNFFGIYYAARGQSGVRLALLAVLKMPLTYTVIVAVALNLSHVPIPDNLFSSISLLADAAIPVTMLILGMQLAELNVKYFDWEKIGFAVIMKMVLAPIIAFFILSMLPMNPLLQKVLIVTAAMPTAVNTTMYALQFNTVPKMVSSITLVNTLLSFITLSIVLQILG